MLLPLAERPAAATVPVRRLTGGEFRLFARVLGAGLGAPPEIVEPIYTAEVLDHPGITAYVAEDENGEAVSVGVSFLNDGYLGVGNFATAEHTRAIAEAMFRDGRAAGAHTAYAHAADHERPLLEEIGFRTSGHWTTLSAV